MPADPLPAQGLTAQAFCKALLSLASEEERQKSLRYFKTGQGQYGEGDQFVGVRMGQVFALAKDFIDMPPGEIEALMESPIHEVRAGALSIMAQQFGRKKTPDSRREELFELYLRRHDHINNWDLVDLAAHKVVGPWLVDKPRDVLYRLARSENMWERRTAMLATFAFIRRGEFSDALAIAEILLADREDLIHKVTGWMLREVGRHSRPELLSFLERHAATMPRTALRTALEHFPPEERSVWMGRK